MIYLFHTTYQQYFWVLLDNSLNREQEDCAEWYAVVLIAFIKSSCTDNALMLVFCSSSVS